MGSRLSKNILQIELIESRSLAKCWSDWRSVTKVIANFLKPFWVKQALVIYLLLIGLKNNAHGWEMGWNYRSHVPSIRSELLELRVEGGFRLHYLPISRSGIFRFVHVHVFLLDFPISADSDRQLSGNGKSDAQFSSQSFGLAVSGESSLPLVTYINSYNFVVLVRDQIGQFNTSKSPPARRFFTTFVLTLLVPTTFRQTETVILSSL